MTPAEIQSARLRLGMSQRRFAEAVGLRGGTADRRVRAWEAGEYPPSGPVQALIKRLVADHEQITEDEK
jgi:DNA-binding transcriptional regulator YiaG